MNFKCTKCGRGVSAIFELSNGLCVMCRPSGSQSLSWQDKEREEDRARQKKIAAIILTTETAHNLPVSERLGIVTAECVFGMHLFKDLFSVGRDIFGGRSAAVQNTLKDARNQALNEMRAEAHALGADAVVGVDLDYSEISGGGKSMLFVVASGTAVRLGR